jgi:hypothetical protein
VRALYRLSWRELDAELVIETAFKRTVAPKIGTPSSTARSTDYFANQTAEDAILDNRRAATASINTVAPPIQLFNPAFAYFSSKAFDPNYDVPPEFVRNVVDFMGRCAVIYLSEASRRDQLKSYLQNVIGHPLVFISNADRTAPDFVALSPVGFHQAYLVVGEEKNELGDGGSDPSTQAPLSYAQIYRQADVKHSILLPPSLLLIRNT